ncbi:hypothetical protein K2173_001580 [Erythroxylum novogranatense]|uniref:Protein SCAR n=1 Tax=Erythroxylum novogranatense TaxID=1862640 RepID=A0AAV8T462_9ROSI|nr:hypothetical protein K2173_001580 [Erythroxylum novogranatense]
MPLVRFEVRNEYGLGRPELYKEADEEDPKAVLDGVAVAGLVGILRQLGDLAEFAAEVFHGLQEQVATTSSRSHKLMVRVQRIEVALPSLEKSILAQTSHIHFAYTAGSRWHPRIQNEQNHFINNDLPRFIMDSYEECRDPPRLHLLDKFDTGNPGSCLKRYSDPTLFRKRLGNFKEPDVGKFQRDNKAHKNKKKGSSLQRNCDLLRPVSITNHGGRVQFAPPTANAQPSSVHTASTIDVTLKYDLGDRTNSFDTRTGSWNKESFLHLSSSSQLEEDELSSRSIEQNDMHNSSYPSEQPEVTADDFPHSLSTEKITDSSSCVTRDEKAEIVEPDGQHCDEVEAPETLTTDFDLDVQERKFTRPVHSDQPDAVHDERTTKSSTNMDEFDEDESELDYYMDALNIIETESENDVALNPIETKTENDVDFQTKHEVDIAYSDCKNGGSGSEVQEATEDTSEHFLSKADSHTSSDISHNEIACDKSEYTASEGFANEQLTTNLENITHEYTAQISDHHQSNNEHHTSSDISQKEEVLCEFPTSIPSKTSTDLQASPYSGRFSNAGYSLSSEGCIRVDPLDGSKVQSLVNASSGMENSNLPERLSNMTTSNSCRPHGSHAEISNVAPVTFWTNGGLLGLQPSKPPDFTASNSAGQVSASNIKDELISPVNHTSMTNMDGEMGKSGRSVKDGSMDRISSSVCSTSWHADQDGIVEKSGDSNYSYRHHHDYMRISNINIADTPGEKILRKISVSHESEEISSQSFGIGHRLLSNSFGRLVLDGKHELPCLHRPGVLDQSLHNGITHQTTQEKSLHELFENISFADSLTSSPPLEHMKLSFLPIDTVEVSRMKLKFPDVNHNESSRDMFTSFQLVPDPGIPKHVLGHDSDDDTFCRSSPYISDDYLSHNSDSDNENWGCNESPDCKENELYSTMRISPFESVSRSLLARESGNDGVDGDTGFNSIYSRSGADPSHSASMMDLPGLETVNCLPQREEKDNWDQMNVLDGQHQVQSSPLPPPLPPLQWRVSEAHSYLTNDRLYTVLGADEHAFDLKLLESSLSQQLKTFRPDGQQLVQGDIALKTKNKEWEKLNAQKEANQPANVKGMDEKEDFLQQIRAKSFTLRHTVTTRPTLASDSTANDKLTAILQKANAIRQVVASDDGEDDSWSDP